MASRGNKAYSEMDTAVTYASEDSAVVDVDEEEGVLPHIESTTSNDRLFQEGRRRRGLFALLAVGVAVVALVSWTVTRPAQFHADAVGDDETEAFQQHTKKNPKEKAEDSHAHVADVAASAVVSLADSDVAFVNMGKSEARTPSVVTTKAAALRGATEAELSGRTSGVAPGPVAMDTKEDSIEVSDMPGADYIGDAAATSARAQGPAVEDKKEESLQSSNMPGKAAALQDSDFPGAEDSKEESLLDSNMPGAAYSDGKAASLEQSDFPGAEDDKGMSLEESDMPGTQVAAPSGATAAPPSRSPTTQEVASKDRADVWTVLEEEQKLLSETSV